MNQHTNQPTNKQTTNKKVPNTMNKITSYKLSISWLFEKFLAFYSV